MISNAELLADIEKAMKAMTVSEMGTSVLQPQYFNQFIREATENTAILSEARFMEMNAQVANIDRIGFSSRILQVVAEETDISVSSDATPAQNVLTAKEFVAMTGVTDQALRRNIERENFESTLISLMAERVGFDLEEKAVFGDTAKYTGGGDGGAIATLHAQDGWIKRAGTGQHLYGTGAGKDYDYVADGIMGTFDACIDLYPKAYLRNPAALRFYVGWDYYDGYRSELLERETGLGDMALTSDMQLVYKGIPVKYAAVLDSTAGIAAYGKAAMLVDPSNLVYGVFKDITIEPDRVPKARKTDFVLTIESDQDFENETAFAVAFPEATHPQMYLYIYFFKEDLL